MKNMPPDGTDLDRPETRGRSGSHAEIGAKLRSLYAEVESEPIPKHLIDLLEQLDEVEETGRKP